MDSLSDVRTSMTMTLTHQNSAIDQKTNTIPNIASHSMHVMARMKKLEPQRIGGWSWDGSSNKIAKKDVKLQHYSTTDKVARINDVVSTDNMVIPSVKDCILFHAILWLPYCASDISIEIEYRERFHILIQCAVCTLWRSRIASEDSHEKKVMAVKNDERFPFNRTAGTNKIHNDDSSSNNDGLSQSKKRKFQSDEKSEIAPKNLVQPTLSLVFLDGSTASITQEQLTLSMARKRMAAPTEYQVLSSIVELLNDPILQLIQKNPNILQKNYPDAEKVNGLSSNKNSEKNEELSGLVGRKGVNENNDLKDGLWIQSLQSLLPKSLNRKQRKKIHIIDINDLLSSTIGDMESVNRNNDVNYNGMSRNESFNQGENLLPSLSSIVYGFQDTVILPGLSQDNAHSNHILDENEDEEIPSQVLVLLRPAVHYISKTVDKSNQNLTAKSPFSSSKTSVFNSKIGKSVDQYSSSIPSDNMDFYTKFDQKRYSEIENTELNKMLNEYMYGKNSKKYDITAKSVLYCTASLFSSISNIQQSVLSASDDTLPQTIKGHSKSIHHTHHTNTRKRNTLENPKSKLKYVSPGIAVCVLQHWAYNKKLLPTLQTAQENYLRIVS